MNKIRVIDLLNKIANGEELPNRVIWNNLVYKLVIGSYVDYCGETLIGSLNFDGSNLNDEVEIIEKDSEDEEIIEVPKKIPKKLKCKYTSQIGKIELAKTINEIIDYLESKGE